MDEKIDSREPVEAKKGGMNMKVLIIGLPIFIIQLIAVYFITGNFLLSRFEAKISAEGETETETKTEAKSTKHTKSKKKKNSNEGESNFFYSCDDLIINPSGTNGQRLMLVSVGFGVSTDEEAKKLKEKEVLIKDIVISTLSSRTLSELNTYAYRDSLKEQISKMIVERMPDEEINSVYFSKYIIQ